jgi:hypothetical protein
MMAMAKDEPVPEWRNFAAWSAVAASFYILAMWVAIALLHQDALDAILRPTKVTAELGLALMLAMAVTGLTNRKRAVGIRTLRNFLIWNAVAVIFFLLVVRGFSAGALRTLSASEWGAAVTGSTLIICASLGILALTSAHTGAGLIEDEAAAEEMRERGRLFLYSFIWTAASGLLLIVLGLSGRGGVLSPTAALAGALVLIAVLVVLGLAAWRLSDELGRTLSRESGNMACYLILAFGGGWAMLAHLRFVAAPAPLDWMTLLIALLYVASFIAVGRRKLLTG